MKHHVLTLLLGLALLHALSAVAHAEPEKHGPNADPGFPSHHFRLAAHTPPGVQLAFHYGLLQPLVSHGFNAAVDVRFDRVILTYSHGAALDFSQLLPRSERAAGLRAYAPFSTGGGVGVLLIDELYVLLDVKLHHYQLSLGAERASYYTMTVGGELGWRFFVWKGLYVSPVLRYWPNVWSSRPHGVVLQGGAFVHQPLHQGAQGFFGNVLIGWAFDV